MYSVLADVPHFVRLQLRRGAALILTVFGLYALEPVSYTHLTLPTTPYV